MAVVCALKLYNKCRRADARRQLSAQTTTYNFLKHKKWQLDVSLSLTSAAALRASADKLTPFFNSIEQTGK